MSGDATCNGLQSVAEGSRTMRLATVDNAHGRCRFPAWLTDHHTWLTLDHKATYKFSLRNATLRISMQRNENGDTMNSEYWGETRVVCHSILLTEQQRKVQIVAHVTAGCDSGYVCMVFHRRDNNIIEIQQSTQAPTDNTDDACRYFDYTTASYTTLITPSLPPKRCPHVGRYTVSSSAPIVGRKRRDDGSGAGTLNGAPESAPECLGHDYRSLAIGCSNNQDAMEFRSDTCAHQPISAYTCHGGWQDKDNHYVIASPVARKSTDALRYCLVLGSGGLGTQPPQGPPGTAPPNVQYSPLVHVTAFAGTCHRPNNADNNNAVFAFNFTTNGTCAESQRSSATRPSSLTMFSIIILTTATILYPPR